MNLLFVVYFSVLIASIGLGVLLSRALLKNPSTAKWISASAAGVLLAICFLYLLPESLHFLSMGQSGQEAHHTTEHQALWMGFGVSLGFLSILSMERYLLRIRHHASCSSGHQTHDHHHHTGNEHSHAHDQGTVWPLAVTLCLHSLFDGVALRSADQSLQIGVPLLFGLVLHKVPETASLMTILRKGNAKPLQQLVIFILFAISTPVGLWIAHYFQHAFSQQGAGFLMAFAAGSLLHLLSGHLLPETTESESGTSKSAVFGLMLLGFLILALARLVHTL